MRTERIYNEHAIAVTDEGPLGFEDGTYIVSGSVRGWSVFLAESPSSIHGCLGTVSFDTTEDAIAAAMQLIDEDIAQLEQQRANEVAFRNRVAQPPTTTGHEISVRSNNTSVSVPLSLLISLHNRIPYGDELRSDIKKNLREASKHDGGIAGVLVSENDELHFDEARATANVHKRKQERYTKSLLDRFERAKNDLNAVLGSQHELEKIVLSQPLGLVPLVELTQASATVSVLTAKNAQVQSVLSLLGSDPTRDR